MTSKKPLPCYLCGQPVRHLGAVQWNGSGDPKDGYLTDLHPVCATCMADPAVRRTLTKAIEATN